MLRTRLIEALGALGDEPTVAEARRRDAARASAPGDDPAALRKTILDVVAGHADAATWDALRARAKAETSPVAKDELYLVLAHVDDDALAGRALELSIGDEPGATNGAAMLSAIAEKHPELAFDFAVAHRERVETMVSAAAVSLFFPRLASSSIDAALAGRLAAFADAHIAAESRRPADAAIARIRYRAIVARERLAAVDDWLRSRPP